MRVSPFLVVSLILITAPKLVIAQSRRVGRYMRSRGKDYGLFIFNFGYTPYSITGASPSVAFDYSYVNLPSTFHYNSTAHVTSGKGFNVNMSGAIEYGRVDGISASLAVGHYYLGENELSRFEFAIGYNFKLKNSLVLHPSLGWGSMETDLNFANGIDNRNKDVFIFGQVYPYDYSYTVKGVRHDYYSDNTNVELQDNKNGLLIQCELRTDPLRRLAFGITTGYYFFDQEKLNVTIYNSGNDQTYDFDNPALHYQSALSRSQFYNFNGFFCKATISFCFARDPHKKRYHRW